jgi:hypothetical protein
LKNGKKKRVGGFVQSFKIGYFEYIKWTWEYAQNPTLERFSNEEIT